jgi:hypothetical protein
MDTHEVWVFNSTGGQFPAGVFSRMGAKGGCNAALHSGRWVGAPVASLRCHTPRPGKVSINKPAKNLPLRLNCATNKLS